MDGHHGVEQEGEIDPLCLNGKFEVLTVTVKRPRTLRSRDADTRFVRTPQQPIFNRPIWNLVYYLNRSISDGHDGDQSRNEGGLDTSKGGSGF